MIGIKRGIIVAIFAAFAFLIFAIFNAPKQKCYERTVYNAFDTISKLTVYSNSDNTSKYEETLHTLSAQLDIHIADSLISRLNSGEEVVLSDDIAALLTNAAYYSDILSDYFDITVNPLVESWTLAEKQGRMPDNITEKLNLVGIDSLIIDEKSNTAQITLNGASITLAAVAKGYAADVIVSQMKADGVNSALVYLGGNIYALGKKPDGGCWSIAVADPNNSGTPLLSVNISDKAVVTSGDYERYFEIGDKKFNHIINPKTGYPADNGIHSVTIMGENAMLCDILSTAVFVAGRLNAKEIAEQFNVDIIIVDDNSVYFTENLNGMITMHKENYSLILL